MILAGLRFIANPHASDSHGLNVIQHVLIAERSREPSAALQQICCRCDMLGGSRSSTIASAQLPLTDPSAALQQICCGCDMLGVTTDRWKGSYDCTVPARTI